MSSNFYSVGLNHVGAYQVSGIPFVTGSTDTLTNADEDVRFQFPRVTKSITIKNTSNTAVRVHFAPWNAGAFGYVEGASTNNNYFVLDKEHDLKIDVKCKEIFISSTTPNQTLEIQLCAELTNIPASRMFSLDGLEGVTQ